MSQMTLQTLIEDSRQAAIYHLPPAALAPVKEAAKAAGFACFELALDDHGEIPAVLTQLGRGLGFPAWYGNNLDALKDCLSDLSWCKAAGYLLIISGTGTLQAANSAALGTLNEVFAAVIDEWRAQGVPMWVFYDLRVDGLATFPTPA